MPYFITFLVLFFLPSIAHGSAECIGIDSKAKQAAVIRSDLLEQWRRGSPRTRFFAKKIVELIQSRKDYRFVVLVAEVAGKLFVFSSGQESDVKDFLEFIPDSSNALIDRHAIKATIVLEGERLEVDQIIVHSPLARMLTDRGNSTDTLTALKQLRGLYTDIDSIKIAQKGNSSLFKDFIKDILTSLEELKITPAQKNRLQSKLVSLINMVESDGLPKDSYTREEALALIKIIKAVEREFKEYSGNELNATPMKLILNEMFLNIESAKNISSSIEAIEHSRVESPRCAENRLIAYLWIRALNGMLSLEELANIKISIVSSNPILQAKYASGDPPFLVPCPYCLSHLPSAAGGLFDFLRDIENMKH